MSDITFGDILQMAEDDSFIHPTSDKVPAVVHTAVYKKSSNGNDMLAVTYRITGGPNAGKGRPVRHYIMFDRDTGLQQASNLGYPAKDFASLKGMSPADAIARVAAVVLGKSCAIDIEKDEYQGRPQNKVKWVHPAQPQGRPAAAAVKAESTAAVTQEVAEEEDELTRLRRQVAAAEAAEAAKAEAKPKRSSAPSDLPF